MVEARIFKHASEVTWRIGAVRANTTSPYILTGGTLSVIYVNNRIYQTDSDAWHEVVPDIITVINSEVESRNVGFISGGESADFAFSYPVAYFMYRPHVGIRKAEAGHGLGGRLIGEIDRNPLTPQKRRGVHVADLITDGGSAAEWVQVLRYEGLEPTDYVAVFDRLQGGRATLNQLGVRLHALSEMNEEFFGIGIDLGTLTRQQYEGDVIPYLSDTKEWGIKFLRKNPDYALSRIRVKDGRVDRDTLRMFLRGYPELVPEMALQINEKLRSLGSNESIEEISQK